MRLREMIQRRFEDSFHRSALMQYANVMPVQVRAFAGKRTGGLMITADGENNVLPPLARRWDRAATLRL
jgi:hypothetical protein